LSLVFLYAHGMGFTFNIDDLRVFFPYDTIYPEQYKYMCELKKALDAHGNGVLEMPTGTGKTVTLLSLITSYQLAHPEVGKLIYCTRTVPEMSKALEELRVVIDFRDKELSKEKAETDEPELNTADGSSVASMKKSTAKASSGILAVGLSARRNMCVHPEVSKEGDRDKVDEMCRQLTAPWIRDQPGSAQKGAVCCHYEKYQQALDQQSQLLESGVYTVEDLRSKGVEDGYGWCPYFAARRLLQSANVVVLNYQYVLDPKVSMASQLGGQPVMPQSFSSFGKGAAGQEQEASIVVFDEAHNIDDVCIESLSVTLNRARLDQSSGNLQRLSNEIDRVKREDAGRLQDEYRRLVQGLQQAGQIDAEVAERLRSPVLPDDLVSEAIPGNIRRAEHFVALLRRIVNFFRRYLLVEQAQCEGPLSVVHKIEEEIEVDSKSLKFCHERLRSLLNTLKVANLDEFTPITKVADFVTLLGTYSQGFTIIVDPYPEAEGIYDPNLLLSCLDASLAIRPVLKRYRSTILTSGTMSPLDMYPKILGMTNVIVKESFSITMDRKCLCPLIVTHGPDQVPLTSRFSLRDDPSVIRNYGDLLEELVKVVPDGMVCFFTSYRYMEHVVEKWYETGVIARVLKHKLVFVETPDVVATTYALGLFRQACDSGQGAVFLSVARGKVAEGIDFDRHYGRCVALLGVPFQYTLSRELRARLQFLREQYQIRESEFLNFDAMRQASQCVGRVIRSKKDYGVMVFADQRYARADKRSKIPDWIQASIEPGHMVMATDVAVQVARRFLLQMSQPFKPQQGIGASVLTKASLLELIAREHGTLDEDVENLVTDAPVTEKLVAEAPNKRLRVMNGNQSSNLPHDD
jgi:DNA excision repair protein ERCC-2